MYFPNEKKFQIQTCQVTHGTANLSQGWKIEETSQRKGEGGDIWALCGPSFEGEGLALDSVGTDRRSWSSTRKC